MDFTLIISHVYTEEGPLKSSLGLGKGERWEEAATDREVVQLMLIVLKISILSGRLRRLAVLSLG